MSYNEALAQAFGLLHAKQPKSMRKRISARLTKRRFADWLKVLFLLLDDAAVLVVLILVLRFFQIQIPWPVMVFVALLAGGVIFVTHRAIMPGLRMKSVTGSEGMIGAQGKAVKPLTPVGAISVKGEYWKARSVDQHIEADEDVEIVGLEGLTLKVKLRNR